VDPNKRYISDQECNNHFNSIKDKQVLDSFIIEKVAKFEVGNIILHDSCQVHVTGNMSYKDSVVTNKIGVRFGVYTDIANICHLN
jgi:hypothetical protein